MTFTDHVRGASAAPRWLTALHAAPSGVWTNAKARRWRTGSKAVVRGNCSTTTQSVHGWQLVDRKHRVTKLDAEIPADASAIVSLDASGVQVGNSGGDLVLQDDEANQGRQSHPFGRRCRRSGSLCALPAMMAGDG